MPASSRSRRTSAFRLGVSKIGNARRHSIEGKPGNSCGGDYGLGCGGNPVRLAATKPWPSDCLIRVPIYGTLPGYRLHPLKGNLKPYWSIAISGNWRIIFRFDDGDVYDVDPVDYH